MDAVETVEKYYIGKEKRVKEKEPFDETFEEGLEEEEEDDEEDEGDDPELDDDFEDPESIVDLWDDLAEDGFEELEDDQEEEVDEDAEYELDVDNTEELEGLDEATTLEYDTLPDWEYEDEDLIYDPINHVIFGDQLDIYELGILAEDTQWWGGDDRGVEEVEREEWHFSENQEEPRELHDFPDVGNIFDEGGFSTGVYLTESELKSY